MILAPHLTTDSHFLSATNPLATADQRDVEALAIRLIETPAFVAGRNMAAHRWRSLVGQDPDAGAWTRFDGFIDECAFGNMIKAVNGDPNHPKVVRLVMPPHEWFGMQVPGSRFGGGPGIDQSYAIVPVDYGGRYELNGRWIGEAPADHVYTLTGNAAFTNVLGHLELSQLRVRDDGTYTVTVDAEPANGRPNHIQTRFGAQYLFIRCCRSDWRQPATALTVRRLDPPTRPPWTEAQITERAVQLLLEDGPAMYVWMRYFQNLEANTVALPFGTGNLGGLVSQTISFARLVLTEDQAFVLTIDPADAKFHDLQMNDWWFNALGDYTRRTGTLNNAQSAKCADGTIVYVVSIRDPGIYNWADTMGQNEVMVVHRWQRLPTDASAGARPAGITGQLVPFDQLPSFLPADVRRVSPAQRAAQLTERLETYQLRLVDH